MSMNVRDKIAHQLGLFFIANLELEDLVEEQKKQIAALLQQLPPQPPVDKQVN